MDTIELLKEIYKTLDTDRFRKVMVKYLKTREHAEETYYGASNLGSKRIFVINPFKRKNTPMNRTSFNWNSSKHNYSISFNSNHNGFLFIKESGDKNTIFCTSQFFDDFKNEYSKEIKEFINENERLIKLFRKEYKKKH